MTTITPGIAPTMLNGRPVIPADLHGQLCGWRTRTPDDVEPGVAWCAGCALPVRKVASDPAVSMTTTQAAPAGVRPPNRDLGTDHKEISTMENTMHDTDTLTVAPCPDWCRSPERCEWETDKETGLPERYHERAFGVAYICQRERVVPMQPVLLDAPKVRLSISEFEEHSRDELLEMAEHLTAAVAELDRITGAGS